MAVWMELHCENAAYTKVAFWKDNNHHTCWSSVNSGPMLKVRDTQQDVAAGYGMLQEQARKMGWVKTRKPVEVEVGVTITGWICPHCAAHELGLTPAK